MAEQRKDLRVIIRPERLYVESLPTENCEVAGDFEHFVCHIVLAWRGQEFITLERVEVRVEGGSGSVLRHVYDGAELERCVAASQPLIRGAEAASSTRMEARQVAGLLARYFHCPAALRADRLVVRALAKSATSEQIESVAEAPLLRYESNIRYSLPFEGSWWAANGHAVGDYNYHYLEPSVQFGYDFMKLGEGGMAHRGDGRRCEDFFCYGEPILAVGDGEVVKSRDGMADGPPGESHPADEQGVDPDAAVGNVVVIRHDEDEFSCYAHLKQHSVGVSVGDAVERGQRIGLCGNSGRSTCPHLHFHVMAGPEPFGCVGLPVRFRGLARRSGIIHSRDVVPVPVQEDGSAPA